MIILFSPILFWVNSILISMIFYWGTDDPDIIFILFCYCIALLALFLSYILKALQKPLFRLLATIALPAACSITYGPGQAIALLFLFAVAWLYLAEFAFIARRIAAKNKAQETNTQ